MPAKRQFKDESSSSSSSEESTDEETTDTSSDSEEQEKVPTTSAVDTSAAGGGQVIANNPHDEAFNVEDNGENRIQTPPADAPTNNAPGAAGTAPATETPSGGENLQNNPHDEAFAVEEARNVKTPPSGQQAGAPAGASAAAGQVEGKMIRNASHDEFSDVEDDMAEGVETPKEKKKEEAGQPQAGARTQGVAPGELQNMPHDFAEDAEGSSVDTDEEDNESPDTSQANAQAAAQQHQLQQQQQQAAAAAAAAAAQQKMQPPQESSSEEVSTDDEEGAGGKPVMGQIAAQAAQAAKGAPDYNPQDYAHLIGKLPREVSDLFSMISAYQPAQVELPTKFRPFVPDYIPCVGDIDTFCKMPRPDGVPDNLGLVVVDEPSSNQSNPAVVKIWLQYEVKQPMQSNFVESVENAIQRPAVIEKWVADIKELHYKKPLPTVSYSKPMPEIVELLQVWPQEFEEMLSSDVQFPPPSIDLDIDQYVRVMCAVLDIPIYNNVIEALHLMFTLYLEFRANQHFQHV